ELVHRQLAGDRHVVVAAERDVRLAADKLAAGVGVRAVADDVAQAPDLVDVLTFDLGDHRLEGLEVAVDVGDDRDAHQGAAGGVGRYARPDPGFGDAGRL